MNKCAKWYKENRERHIANVKANYYLNREKILAKRNEYRKRIGDHVVQKVARSLKITHAEARQQLGYPPLRSYTRHGVVQ
jgi:3-methyladenine DNA glycosylase AlkD